MEKKCKNLGGVNTIRLVLEVFPLFEFIPIVLKKTNMYLHQRGRHSKSSIHHFIALLHFLLFNCGGWAV